MRKKSAGRFRVYGSSVLAPEKFFAVFRRIQLVQSAKISTVVRTRRHNMPRVIRPKETTNHRLNGKSNASRQTNFGNARAFAVVERYATSVGRRFESDRNYWRHQIHPFFTSILAGTANNINVKQSTWKNFERRKRRDIAKEYGSFGNVTKVSRTKNEWRSPKLLHPLSLIPFDAINISLTAWWEQIPNSENGP
jgi:hypothetical protein